jgi:hypothetical protein
MKPKANEELNDEHTSTLIPHPVTTHKHNPRFFFAPNSIGIRFAHARSGLCGGIDNPLPHAHQSEPTPKPIESL